jgi:hypothetical protein
MAFDLEKKYDEAFDIRRERRERPRSRLRPTLTFVAKR